jgi:hypothetical protein
MTTYVDQPQNLWEMLADARAEKRTALDTYSFVKAEAEQRAIDAAGGEKALGANADSRERALTLALARDRTHQEALGQLRYWERTVERLEASVQAYEDDRRSQERQVRAELVDALRTNGIPLDGRSEHAPASAVLRHTSDRALTNRARGAWQDSGSVSTHTAKPVAVGDAGDDDLPF